MKLTLKRKVIGLTVFTALLPVVAMFILTFMQKQRIRKTVQGELTQLIRANTERIAKDVYAMCKSTNALIQAQLDHDLNVAEMLVEHAGGLALGDTQVEWTAINQYTDKPVTVSLPEMNLGNGVSLGKNADLSVPTPIVDEVVQLVGGTCTIFQRMNEQGDMLRIATNVPKGGKRAIGTYIPAKWVKDGELIDDQVISRVLNKGVYRGKNFVAAAEYLTVYKPLIDKKGYVFGMLYVGVKRDEVASLRKAIMDIKVGTTGYVYVLQATDSKHIKKGCYIISKGGASDGENIWNKKDENGDLFIQSAVAKAIAAGEGNCGFQTYRWKNPGETNARNKTAAVICFKPWDWVIGAGAYDDDYQGLQDQLGGVLNDLIRNAIIAGLALLLVMVIIAFIMGGKIAGPISKITNVAQVIAEGNLLTATQLLKELTGSRAVRDTPSEEAKDGKVRVRDETGQLLAATRTMARNLSSLVGQVQKSGIQVTTSSTEIAASAKQLEAATAEQAASTNQVVATATEISATSHDLAATMDEVTAVASETADLADSGRSDLTGMEETMRQLAEATRSIGSRLSAINEKANNISSVVTTINKVADQTNLLSLNAAIEAEKAGEYGQGFSVVAREIRRLADQSAVATLDIEQMVGEMQSAVSAGVMEMDKFNTEVRRSVEEMARISEQQAQIIEQVQALTPRFGTVNAGMRTQSESAQQISESMIQLNEAAQQTVGSLREFNKVIEQLNAASHGLQDEVSRFKVSS